MEPEERTRSTEGDAAVAHDDRPTTADIASGSAEARESERSGDAAEARGGDRTADDDRGIASRERDGSDMEERRQPLLADEATNEVRGRWQQIQGSFVDEPRRAVQEADTLVAELMQQLADSFARERQTLESQWDRGDEVSTEDLRVALQRYRSFFDRLLSV